MARKHYWQFLVTDEGNPIENAQISIYIAGTEDPAHVYIDEVGPAVATTAPQVVTSRKGYFEFWVADRQEPNGYALNTKFKLAWSAPGVQTGYIDFIDVFSTSVAEVDETDTNQLKNKAVSNFLAKGWEDHKNSVLYVNGVTSIHGMGPVDESQWDGTIAGHTKLNKLVSNVLANNWESHSSTYYNTATNSWYYTIAGGPVTVANGVGANPGNPHGIEFVNTSSTDTETNKLISNVLANQWHHHRTNTTNGSTDHPQFSLLTGARDYTNPVGYSSSTIVLSAGANDFITKAYVDGKSFTKDILVADWTNNGDGTYSYQVVHGLTESFPVVMVWDYVNNTVIQPVSIDKISTSTTEITMTTNIRCVVRIIK